MPFDSSWPWITLLLLGGFHGLNPAMGWLFAVALGFQERRLRAVVRRWGRSRSVTRWRLHWSPCRSVCSGS